MIKWFADADVNSLTEPETKSQARQKESMSQILMFRMRGGESQVGFTDLWAGLDSEYESL